MLSKIYRLIERLQILSSNTESLRKRWPEAPKLTERHLANCKLLPDRLSMLKLLPKGGVCAELGIWKCEFSESILRILDPVKLHLIDIDPESIQIANAKFKESIAEGRIVTHQNDSSNTILSMEDNYFDWIYIDGDHSYDGARKDLEAAHQKIKSNGLISLNDYIYFGSSDLTKYGVIEAVNEFCLKYNYEIIFLALQGRMYNDVTLRQIY